MDRSISIVFLFLHWQHKTAVFYFCIGNIIGIFTDNLLHMLCLFFAFRYLKLHDEIDVDARVTELKLKC